MTGSDFESWIKRLGLKKGEVAHMLGVNPDTITARCQALEVEPLYAYALLGLATQRQMTTIFDISELVGKNAQNNPTKSE